MQNPRWLIVAGTALILVSFGSATACAQQPPPPDAQPAPPAASSTSAKPSKQKYSHANDFLILGTVFDKKGYAFPSVELRIRRSNEKKFRWETYTNSRGDFAIRVPRGSDYEMIAHVKGCPDQTRTLDAKTGLSETQIVFRMEVGKDDKK